MFYPEISLRKGGRFHLCWIADSWPISFASVTQRQLWSHDIRTICDDLMEVMTNESGRPSHRFSLRLSSQLLRGLVLVYQKKANSMITELCSLNAKIMKKFNDHYAAEEVKRRMVPLLRETIPEPEERVEQMIRQSGNVVPNIEAITLKEAAIPEFQLPPNDGFGEENPDQALQLLLQDLTLEQMLGAPGPSSTLDASVPAHPAERSAHEARLQLDNTMERMSEHDVTLFRKSTAQDLLREESDKEIPIPEIPPPDLPIPNKKEKPLPEPEEPAPAPEEPAEVPAAAKPVPQEEILTLETLEVGEPQAKRHKKNKLIIDKTTQLSKKFLRARIENINVDLRCEEFSEDVADLRVPAEQLLRRAAHAGSRFPCNVARPLHRLFSRNLGLAAARPHQGDVELAVASRVRRATAQIPEAITEEPAHIPEPQLQQQQLEPQVPEPIPMEEQTMVDLSAVDVEKDIADLPTQKLTAQKGHSQETQNTVQKKKLRCGSRNFRESQSQNHVPPEPEIVEKENIPDNWQTIPARTEAQPIIPNIQIQRASDPERVLTSMLQEVGLADLQMTRPERPSVEVVVEEEEPPRKSRRRDSGSSEPQLGSLDRTRVSLGDSDHTTDSQRFISDQWGTEGTMVKILTLVKAKTRPLNLDSLMYLGPMVPGSKNIIRARCFTSLLKLKQHGFIKLRKDPDTLAILDIFLGPKFDTC